MGQKKLKRFAEIATFPNVLQYPEDIAGKWSGFFGNDHPIVLELACGKSLFLKPLINTCWRKYVRLPRLQN